jgi:putative DNA primase/helicase
MQLAKETARHIYIEAGQCQDDGQRDTLAKWARSSEHSRNLKAIVDLAKTEPGISIEVDVLDKDVWLFNCTNGTLDLRSGQLKEASRDDLITKSSNIEFDPGAECPKWEAFVKWAMDDRDDLVTFIQRAFGYSLTGDVSERLVFFLHGTGRNGKSTMLKVFRHVLGEYGLRVAATTFEKPLRGGGGGNATPHIAQLKGARFVTTSEMEDGTELAAAMLKDVTGDETIAARPMYEAPFEFMPEFKPWIGANHRPTVSADDQAIWDRLRLIPFDARVSDDEVDRELGEHLKAEATGILAWAVRGCADWLKHGLTIPAAVADASQNYRESMDTFTDFLDWIGDLEDNGLPMNFSPQALRDTYNDWARREGLDRLSQRQFRTHMAQHGWYLVKSNNARTWRRPTQKQQKVNYGVLAAQAALDWEKSNETT